MKTNLTKEEIHSLTRLGRLEYELGRYTKEQLDATYNSLQDADAINELAAEAGYGEADDYLDSASYEKAGDCVEKFDLWNTPLSNVIHNLVNCCYTIDDVVYSDRTSYTNAMENSIRKMIV